MSAGAGGVPKMAKGLRLARHRRSGRFEVAPVLARVRGGSRLVAGEHNYGCCYKDGRGTEVDLGKARYWFGRAAAKGDEPEGAIDNLARLDARV